MLFGIDYIQDAEIISEVSNKRGCFSNEPSFCFELFFESVPNEPLETYSIENSRSDGESMLIDDQRRLNDFLNQRGSTFCLVGESTPYAKHHINTNNHQPIASSPYRMSPANTFLLEAELDRLSDEAERKEYESPCATGKSAAYLTFGRELRTPDDVRSDFRTISGTENFLPQIPTYLRKIATTWQ
ncbi:hypothetical protein JTB14_011897 [Gonioctena quinquepunctata]|nr:hypothetical protein JTB14_011897 [Gonioctena quinquepunctata]